MKIEIDVDDADKARRLLEAGDVDYTETEDYESDINIVPDDLRQAAGLIAGGFVWERTKEGVVFWKGVRQKLLEYAEMGESDEVRG